MAQIIQINAAPGAEELKLVREAALPCHLSFGHFRGRTGSMKSLLSDAVKVNETGVVLYSSRHPSRVAELAVHLTELEGQ
jgi:hypothetical protein